MGEAREKGAGAHANLLRATLTLLAGGVVAQALPLLLGPLLTRQYAPAEFGIYHLFAAVAANVAVVACARYEFALPLARDEAEAGALLALCLHLLCMASALTAIASIAWAWTAGKGWPLWLAPAVAALGAVSVATLWATRAQRFRTLVAGRVTQYGGGALLQVAAGTIHAGVTGLVAAPIACAALAVVVLRPPLPTRPAVSRDDMIQAARRYRQFPLLNTPHAFAGALQDTLSVALVAGALGADAAGLWGVALRYLKAPATLVGAAVSQALYPRLAGSHGRATAEGRRAVAQVMGALALIATPLVLLLWLFAPWAFEKAFGNAWREAGELARSLALYIGLHFVASPLGVVTMAWNAQAWALKLALVGQLILVVSLAIGLHAGGLRGAGWAVSVAMTCYFGWYFWKLSVWPVAARADA
jgi:O-antigen/teichoic acid export membrane protein